MFLDEIKKAEPGREVWDKDERGVTGLYARVMRDGRVHCYFFYRAKGTGQKRNIKVGVLGELTIGEIREIARKFALDVANSKDPKAERDKLGEEKTVTELFEATYEGHYRPMGTTWALKDSRKFFEKYAQKGLGKLRVSEVSTVVVNDWHKSLSGKPYAANRALAVLSVMFNYGITRGWVESNPCEKVDKFDEMERETHLDPDEDLPRVFKLLQEARKEQPVAAAFCFAAIKSGARLVDLEKLTWNKIRVQRHEGQEWGVFRFEGKKFRKTGELDQLLFDAEVMSWFRTLPKRDDGRVLGIETPHEFWYSIRKKIGREDVWLRDSRRTFAVVALDAGVSDSQIGQSLNQVSVQTVRKYARLRDRTRMNTMATVAQAMNRIRKK